MKRKLIIAWSFGVLGSSWATDSYQLNKKKEWINIHQFETEVRGPHQQLLGKQTFVSDKVPQSFKLTIPSSFPKVSLETSQGCDQFHSKIAQWVSKITLKKCTYKYTAHLKTVSLKESLTPENQTPLKCTLEQLYMDDNYAIGLLEPRAIFVKIGDPQDNIVVNIKNQLSHLWKGTPLKVLRKEMDTQTEIIVSIQNNTVLLSSGNVTFYEKPHLEEIHDFQNSASEKRVVNYQPGIKVYKDALFATIFSATPLILEEDEWKTCDEVIQLDEDDEFGEMSSVTSQSSPRFVENKDSEEGSVRILNSEIIENNSMKTRSKTAMEKPTSPGGTHYKIEGKPKELDSPFIYNENGKNIPMRVFHQTCYPLVNGEPNLTDPHILQYYLKGERPQLATPRLKSFGTYKLKMTPDPKVVFTKEHLKINVLDVPIRDYWTGVNLAEPTAIPEKDLQLFLDFVQPDWMTSLSINEKAFDKIGYSSLVKIGTYFSKLKKLSGFVLKASDKIPTYPIYNPNSGLIR